MKTTRILRSLLLAALGLALCPGILSAGETPLASAQEQSRRELRIGQTLRYDDGGLKITFLSIPKDARCPINATCTDQGDAVAILRVKIGKKPARNYRLHTNRKPDVLVLPVTSARPGIPKSYVVRIDSLSPLPTAGKKTPQSAYRLALGVSTAQ